MKIENSRYHVNCLSDRHKIWHSDAFWASPDRLFMVAPWNRASHYIFVMRCGFFYILYYFFFFFSSPYLSRRRVDAYHTSTHDLSANLRCRSETCCTRLAENTGHKKSPKVRHFGTIAQICRAISSQLRHVSTVGKKLVKQQYYRDKVRTIYRTSAY